MFHRYPALRFSAHIVLAFLLGAYGNPCWAEVSTSADPAERQRADALFKGGKCIEALPLYEKLAVQQPNDITVKEELAWCLFQQAQTLTDAEQRKQVQTRARSIALEAHKQGDNSQLMQAMLDMPVDGTLPTFSDRKYINALMHAAEADFARGDLEQAIAGYERVLQHDPKNYEAPLYTGDVYFKMQRYDDAATWFGRAIQINSHRETAHRYWGDALLATGKPGASSSMPCLRSRTAATLGLDWSNS